MYCDEEHTSGSSTSMQESHVAVTPESSRYCVVNLCVLISLSAVSHNMDHGVMLTFLSSDGFGSGARTSLFGEFREFVIAEDIYAARLVFAIPMGVRGDQRIGCIFFSAHHRAPQTCSPFLDVLLSFLAEDPILRKIISAV